MSDTMDIELPDGRIITNATSAEALAAGATAGAIVTAQVAATAASVKMALRAKIHRDAGDTLTLVGTNADGVSMLFFEMAKMAKALTEATTVAEVNTAATDFELLTRDFLAGVQADTVKLPYLVKADAPTIFAEIADRAHSAAVAYETDGQGS